MAETAPAPTTNGVNGVDGTNKTFYERVTAIPVVSDTITTVHSTIQSNSYSAAAYAKGEQVATSLYKTAEPAIQKISPQIQQVDSLANKGLDIIQSRVPGLFEVKTEDIYATARKPADQAYDVAKTYAGAAQARLAPITEQFQTQLQHVQQSLNELQNRLSATLKSGQENAPKDASEATGRIQDTVHNTYNSILKELENLSNYVQTQRKELPQQAQASVQPILDRFSSGYSKIREEVTKADVPVTTKAQNILHYTQETVTPLLGDAIDAIRTFVGKKQEQAEGAVDEAASQAKEAKGEAEKKVDQAVNGS
jgi:uncharacterized protein YjbJ (UPF0337 family)/ElaB/YqjD/DUF883 family membrane-anchored ribosome-binding protein